MEVSSVIPWQGLLLTANLFTCGCPHTSARLSIQSVPPRVAEGSSVLLLVYNLLENLRALFWYKALILFNKLEVARHIIDSNSSVPGPVHSGRETVFSNGSMLFHNVTCKDMGFYTLRTVSRSLKVESAHVQLCGLKNVVESNSAQDVRVSSVSWGSSQACEETLATSQRCEDQETLVPVIYYSTGWDPGEYLSASSCTCCNPLASAPLTIEPVPRNAAKGERVLLQVNNLPEDLQAFSWYKGVKSSPLFKIAEYSRTMNSITQGLEHSGRETVYTNGSLLLQDITEKDSGLYTLQILNRVSENITMHMQFHVNKPVTKPFLGVSDTTVTVQSSVPFSCLSADTGISIHWIFNNQSLHLIERMSLSSMKCGLSIFPVRSEDAGEYKCKVFNPVSSKISLPVGLVVMNE